VTAVGSSRCGTILSAALTSPNHSSSSFPNAELELVVGAGHAVWIHDPDHAATTTRRFRGALEQHVHDEEW
jgi:hypothetical protein